MGHPNHVPANNSAYLNTLFYFLITFYMGLGIFLILHIPYTFPFGGPDEPMHLSMAEFIAKHLSWPKWNDPEVVRNAYGVSYSAGGSIVYWLHGLTYRLFGQHRIGAFLLLITYLALAVWIYRKNMLAGFLLLAGLLPQTLFIFSYINSDNGTVLTAILFGMSVGTFITDEAKKTKYFLILLFFAGLAVTARQHLWAIAFITLMWAILYKRKTVFQYNKTIWLTALLLGLLPASWWFVTSYFANDGDVLGIFTNAKSMLQFGKPDLPSLARPWSDISLESFLNSTLTSLYGNWGWTSLGLKTYEYLIAAIFIALITVVLSFKIEKKIFLFFLVLVAANFGFMLLYSTFYDYQPQGRYLFPSIYIILGIMATTIIYKNISSKSLLLLLIFISTFNAFFSTKLALFSYIDALLEKPTTRSILPTKQYQMGAYHIDRLKIADGKLFVKGWAFDKVGMRPFENMHLILKNDNYIYDIELEQRERPDVAAAFKENALENAGFGADMIGLKQLPEGEYSVFFLIPTTRGEQLIPTNRTLKIKSSSGL